MTYILLILLLIPNISQAVTITKDRDAIIQTQLDNMQSQINDLKKINAKVDKLIKAVLELHSHEVYMDDVTAKALK